MCGAFMPSLLFHKLTEGREQLERVIRIKAPKQPKVKVHVHEPLGDNLGHPAGANAPGEALDSEEEDDRKAYKYAELNRELLKIRTDEEKQEIELEMRAEAGTKQQGK